MAKLWCSPGSTKEVGKTLGEVRTPAFVVEKSKVLHNCEKMIRTCETLGVKLRAHTKTHKTLEAALLQTGGTKRSLVCSTLDECEYYADGGFDDILFGFPFSESNLERVKGLMGNLSAFHLMLDSIDSVKVLCQNPPPERKKYSVFLKVDCGKGRAGVWHEDLSIAAEIVSTLHKNSDVVFMGLYVHCGETYSATNVKEVEHIRDLNISRLVTFKKKLTDRTGIPIPCIGIGSTPSCTQPCEAMSQLDELHPGNYVLLDVQQHLLGSGSLDEIAVSVICEVIAHYPRRNQMLVNCGFTALTKQGWGKMTSGYGVIRNNPHLQLSSLHQEHGIIEPINSGGSLDFSSYPVGSKLRILPYHSCATASMYSKYLVVEGDRVVEEWSPTRGW